MNISVIIAAAGASTRMGSSKSKTLLPLGGQAVLKYSLDIFAADSAVTEIVVAAAFSDMAEISRICAPYSQVRVISGGSDRTASVRLALAALTSPCDAIAVHDGARPLLHEQDWAALKQALAADTASRLGGVIPAAHAIDSIKLLGADDLVVTAPDRERVALAQTPQLFRADALRRAYAGDDAATDDAALVQLLGLPVQTVFTRHENFKLTYAADMLRAEQVLQKRRAMSDNRPAAVDSGREVRPMLRIGIGWDSHRTAPDRPLIIGGTEIPCEFGLLGHSDADVLLHAVIDALFGAAGLPDIGRHFPDSSEEYRGITGTELLRRCAAELSGQGWCIENIDSTVIAERPRLARYIPQMQENIARVLNIELSQVNIKAKTAEGQDSVGQCRSIQAQAAVLLSRT